MTSSSSRKGARIEMEIDRDGPTTPKSIIGRKRPIETLQRPGANGAQR